MFVPTSSANHILSFLSSKLPSQWYFLYYSKQIITCPASAFFMVHTWLHFFSPAHLSPTSIVNILLVCCLPSSTKMQAPREQRFCYCHCSVPEPWAAPGIEDGINKHLLKGHVGVNMFTISKCFRPCAKSITCNLSLYSSNNPVKSFYCFGEVIWTATLPILSWMK